MLAKRKKFRSTSNEIDYSHQYLNIPIVFETTFSGFGLDLFVFYFNEENVHFKSRHLFVDVDLFVYFS